MLTDCPIPPAGIMTHWGTNMDGEIMKSDGIKFHVYTTEWEENEIHCYVDGEHYFTFINNGEGHEAWPFDQPFHLILNLVIAGGLGGKKGIYDIKFSHTMKVDYVRVYQK